MKFSIATLLLLALISSIESKAQKDSSIDERLKQVEDQVKLLEEYKEKVLEEQFSAKSEFLSSSITFELEKAKQEVKNELQVIKITGGILTLIIAFGVGGFFVFYLRKIPKAAERILSQKLKSHLGESTGHMISLITSQKTENQVRESKRVFVVAGDDGELQATLKLLRDMKFANASGKVFRFFEKPETADLIVFSNRSNSLPEDLVKEFMIKGDEQDIYILFGGGRFNFDLNAPFAERLNFANTKYTLYHHIINMLSFQEIMNS